MGNEFDSESNDDNSDVFTKHGAVEYKSMTNICRMNAKEFIIGVSSTADPNKGTIDNILKFNVETGKWGNMLTDDGNKDIRKLGINSRLQFNKNDNRLWISLSITQIHQKILLFTSI